MLDVGGSWGKVLSWCNFLKRDFSFEIKTRGRDDVDDDKNLYDYDSFFLAMVMHSGPRMMRIVSMISCVVLSSTISSFICDNKN